MAHSTRLIPNETQMPCRMLVACLPLPPHSTSPHPPRVFLPPSPRSGWAKMQGAYVLQWFGIRVYIGQGRVRHKGVCLLALLGQGGGSTWRVR